MGWNQYTSMLEWHNEKRKVKDLIPSDYNPRYLTEKDRYDLEQSITKFNEVEPVVINIGSRNNILIGGHQRLIIYADLGKEEIDVRVPNRELTIEEETELNLRLNKNTGSWDWKKLKEINIDQLLRVGFGDEELSDLWDDIGSFDDGYDMEKRMKEIRTTTIIIGNVFMAGKHRIICANPSAIGKNTIGSGFEMVNIRLEMPKGIENKGNIYEKWSLAVKNGIDAGADNSHIFIWADQDYIGIAQEIARNYGVKPDGVCLWIKDTIEPKDKIAFNRTYQPVVYAKKGEPRLNKGMKKISEILNRDIEVGVRSYNDILNYFDLWIVSADKEQPTADQRPVTLHEKPLKRCTSPGDKVLEIGAGAGSMLIACEQLQRTCYAIEQDPLMVQLILDRYEQATGKRPEKM